jgi:hypothetical protein
VDFSFSRFAKTAQFKARARKETVQVHRVTNPYHAVSVVCGNSLMGNSRCPAAKAIEGKRFLASEAPQLPLAGCTCRDCQCRYRHHDDRRAEPRRASDQGMPLAHWPGQEKRQQRGRRMSDH